MISIACQTEPKPTYQIYYDPEEARWKGVETHGFTQPIPRPNLKLEGKTQYFDRHTWSWVYR